MCRKKYENYHSALSVDSFCFFFHFCLISLSSSRFTGSRLLLRIIFFSSLLRFDIYSFFFCFLLSSRLCCYSVSLFLSFYFSLSLSLCCLWPVRSRKHASTHTKWKRALSPFVRWHVHNRSRHRMIPAALLRRKTAFTNAAKLPAVVTLYDAQVQQFVVYRSATASFRPDRRRCCPCRPRLNPILCTIPARRVNSYAKSLQFWIFDRLRKKEVLFQANKNLMDISFSS